MSEYTPSDDNAYARPDGTPPTGSARPLHSCGWCGEQSFEDGFLEDSGQGARGRVRWVEGALEVGLFGGTSLWGKSRRELTTKRCTTCGHLEFFTGDYS